MNSSMPTLTIEVLWKRCWALVKLRWGTLGAVLVLQVLASSGITSFSELVSDSLTPFFSTPLKAVSLSPLAALVPAIINWVVSLLIFPITSLVQAYASVGAIKVCLDVLRGKPFSWARLLKHGLLEWAYMVALLNVIFYVTSIGYMLLLVPGLILSLGFTMSGLILVDRELDPIQALTESWYMMRGQKMFLMLNYFLAGIVLVVGILMCFLGFIPSLMLIIMLAPVMYEMLDRHGKDQVEQPEPTLVDAGPAELTSAEPDTGMDPDADLDTDPGTDPGEA